MPEEIRTQRLMITGPDGSEQAVIEATDTGPAFRLFDPASGAERVVIRIDGPTAEIELRSPDGEPRASLATLDTDDPKAITKSKSRLALTTAQQGGNFFDALVSLEASDDWANLDMRAVGSPGGYEGSVPRVSLSGAPEGASIELLDERLDPILDIPETDSGIRRALRDRMAETVRQFLEEKGIDPAESRDMIDDAGGEVSHEVLAACANSADGKSPQG